MNPLLGMMGGNPMGNMANNPAMASMQNVMQLQQQFKSTMDMVKGFQGGDPNQFADLLAKQNPKFAPISDTIKNGGSLEELVKSECQKQGLDFDQFSQMIKSYQ